MKKTHDLDRPSTVLRTRHTEQVLSADIDGVHFVEKKLDFERVGLAQFANAPE